MLSSGQLPLIGAGKARRGRGAALVSTKVCCHCLNPRRKYIEKRFVSILGGEASCQVACSLSDQVVIGLKYPAG